MPADVAAVYALMDAMPHAIPAEVREGALLRYKFRSEGRARGGANALVGPDGQEGPGIDLLECLACALTEHAGARAADPTGAAQRLKRTRTATAADFAPLAVWSRSHASGWSVRWFEWSVVLLILGGPKLRKDPEAYLNDLVAKAGGQPAGEPQARATSITWPPHHVKAMAAWLLEFSTKGRLRYAGRVTTKTPRRQRIEVYLREALRLFEGEGSAVGHAFYQALQRTDEGSYLRWLGVLGDALRDDVDLRLYWASQLGGIAADALVVDIESERRDFKQLRTEWEARTRQAADGAAAFGALGLDTLDLGGGPAAPTAGPSPTRPARRLRWPVLPPFAPLVPAGAGLLISALLLGRCVLGANRDLADEPQGRDDVASREPRAPVPAGGTELTSDSSPEASDAGSLGDMIAVPADFVPQVGGYLWCHEPADLDHGWPRYCFGSQPECVVSSSQISGFCTASDAPVGAAVHTLIDDCACTISPAKDVETFTHPPSGVTVEFVGGDQAADILDCSCAASRTGPGAGLVSVSYPPAFQQLVSDVSLTHEGFNSRYWVSPVQGAVINLEARSPFGIFFVAFNLIGEGSAKLEYVFMRYGELTTLIPELPGLNIADDTVVWLPKTTFRRDDSGKLFACDPAGIGFVLGPDANGRASIGLADECSAEPECITGGLTFRTANPAGP